MDGSCGLSWMDYGWMDGTRGARWRNLKNVTTLK